MVYIDYEQVKMRFYDTQKRFTNLLLDKERIFTNTLPSGIRYDKDVVQASPTVPLETYVAELEEVEKKLSQARENMKDWEILLSVKEKELRESKDIPDRIYVMRYLDRWGMSRISQNILYSKRQVYRILTKIDKTVEKMSQNVTNDVLK